MVQALQLGIFPMRPAQSTSMPMQVSAAQTGIDISAIMNMMIPMMIMMMMMKMMTGAVSGEPASGEPAGGKPKTRAIKAG